MTLVLWHRLDVIGLLDLVVVRGAHLSLVAGPIPLQTSVDSNLFVVS